MTQQRISGVAHERVPSETDGVPAELGTEAATLPLSFQTLGAARVVLGRTRVVPSNGTLFALLMRVAYSAGLRVRRDELLRLLWPGLTVERQRGNLRQALYKARALGIDIVLEGDTVRLNPAQVVVTFSREQTAALFDRDVVRGEEPFGVFLPSYTAPWPELAEWVEGQRSVVHAGVRRVLAEQLRARRERADWTGAERLARWLLQFDALNEDATLTLAECTMLAGSKAAAVAILDRYLEEIGPAAGDIRLPATTLRKRFTEVPARRRASLAPSERHFVGRATELANLTMAMRRARWHDGSAVLLTGASGIGKSRLAAELSKVAEIEGFRVIEATCQPTEQSRSLGTILDLVPELIEEPGALGCSTDSFETMRTVLPAERALSKTDSLRSRGGIADTDAPQRRPLPTSSAIRASFIDLLLAVSYERPSLLIIDDVQWLDEGSWEVIVDLMDRLENARLYCLLTSREQTPRRNGKGYVPSQLVQIALPPLDEADSATLALAIAADYSAPLGEGLADWFAVASEGGPLYLRALVSHWLETGEAGGVPHSLLSVLDQRLNQLSTDALRVSQTTALLEKLATPELVKEVLELETFRLLDALEELARAGAMRQGQNYIEIHHLLAKSALAKLSRPSVSALRRRIGEVLASKLEQPAAPLELVAGDNLALAGDLDGLARLNLKAFEFFIRAGEAHRAIALYDASAPHLHDHPFRNELQSKLQDALYLGGQYARLLNSPNYLEQIATADPIWDTLHPEEVLRLLEAADHSSNADDYADIAARALILAESPSICSETRLRAATLTIRSAGNSSVPWHAKRAFETANQLMRQMVVEPFRVDQVEMYYHTVFDSLDVAHSAAIRLAAHADSLADQNSRIKILADAAWALRMTGAVTEAKERFEAIAIEARSLRMHTRAAVAATFRSTLAFEIDEDKSQAFYWLNFAAKLAEESGDAFTDFTYQAHRARLAILTDDIETAKSGLAAISNASGGHAIANSYVKSLKIGLARLESDTDTIRKIAPQVGELAKHGNHLLGQDFRTAQLYQALVILDQPDDASRMLHEYVTSRRRDRTPLPAYLRIHVQYAEKRA